MDYFTIIGFSAVLFTVIILNLANPPQHTKKILGWAAAVTAIAALGMYGYGYAHLFVTDPKNNSIYISILRTVFDSCRIFVGSNNWDKIKSAYEMPVWEIVFWVLQLLAMTTSASAVIVSLGSRLLREIRMWLLRMHDITLIFGLNENTLAFGRQLAKSDNSAILYIDEAEDGKLHTEIDRIGAVFRSDLDALNGNGRFLNSIGLKPGKRKLRVYALDRSILANQQFARRLMRSLEARGIKTEQTSLTILTVSEETDHPMQALPERYGYGSLFSVNEPELVARMMIRIQPPYKFLAFDEKASAVKDFHAVIIGFGQIGQAVLRQLIMNSQFQGSTGHIAVFAPDYEKRIGWLSHECRAMMAHYNIKLHAFDGRSHQLYDYLEEYAASINYVAVCAGSDTINLEISERIQPFLQRRSCNAPILMCSSRGVSHFSTDDHIETYHVYTPELLCSDQIDRMAMVLNQSYQQTGDPEENWKQCSYWDRASSRAAADFYDALLYCAGVTQEEALRSWNPQGALLENLSATEHLRWNAFHYCMGFRPMTEQEFQERAAEYLVKKDKDPNTKFRIAKDTDRMIHACMIPWDRLDAYSAKENRITGENRNYAENDRNNVRDLAKVLQAMTREKAKRR